ncbi:tyrosine-type recombinase/integrase [Aeoliella sp. SH292]|uniref:tyrosine-type recombinase/integrase n=1 Tax=Aeoliella sp. SH292 TaxID=3454464 RepID=UPI003F99932D
MARPKQLIPSYRKHRASGQAIVQIAGHTHYLGPHGTVASKRNYDRLIAEWLARDRQPESPPEERITVVALSARYLSFAKGYYQKNGRCTKVVPGIKAMLRYLRDWYGKEAAADFGPVALKAIRQRMVEDGLSRRYINDHVDRLKRMFKWAASEQLVPQMTYQALSTVDGLRRGKTEAHETAPILPVDEGVVDATLPFLSAVVNDMVQLQRFTGMRPAEVCALRPADVDRSSDVWVFTPESHKTEHHGRSRVIFIGPRGQEILQKYMLRAHNLECFRPCEATAEMREKRRARRKVPINRGNRPGTNRKTSPNRTPGDRYDTAAYRRAIHRACDRAFPHPTLGSRKALTTEEQVELQLWQSEHRWSPNQLRHAAATSIRKHFGLEAAQIVLGHASANVTQIYAERDLGKGIEVARAIG